MVKIIEIIFGLKIVSIKIIIIKLGILERIFKICCIIVLIWLLINLEISLYVILIVIFRIVVINVINKEICVFINKWFRILWFKLFVFR